LAESALDRISAHGVNGASLQDLLAVGLSRHAEDVEFAERQSRELLRTVGSVSALVDLTSEELARPTGLERFEVLRAQALFELGRRAQQASRGERKEMSQPDAVAEYLSDLRKERREFFIALLLDSKNALIRRAVIHIGTLNMSVVGAREVFREAIRDGAASIILAHNHPSGDPTPSVEDIHITKELKKVGQLLDIPVLDHVIIGDPAFVSLRRTGQF